MRNKIRIVRKGLVRNRFKETLVVLGVCGCIFFAPKLKAQTIIMETPTVINTFSVPQFWTQASAAGGPGSCTNPNAPWQVWEGTQSATLFINGNDVAGLYSFCRVNATSTIYTIYEHLYVSHLDGGPPITTPQCVGGCVQPEPDPPPMPIPPPYQPPPCFVSDPDCPTGNPDVATQHATENSETSRQIQVLSVEPLVHK